MATTATSTTTTATCSRNAFKITSEFSVNYNDTWGGFFRATYFYDFENADRDDLTELAKEKVGDRFSFLDAFVFHNFDIGGKTGSVRLGQQVVSWGESTFIQGGINVINPIDVSKLRVAGAELKEAFLPVNMIWGSVQLHRGPVDGSALHARVRADRAGSRGHLLLDQRLRDARRRPT